MTLNISPELHLDDKALIGQGIAVFGSPGSGKSNFVRVFIEETGERLPMTIFDVHNEYYTLNERFQFLRVGKGKTLDLQVTAEQAAEIAEFSYKNNISVIVEMLLMDEDEQIEFAYNYCARLWELAIETKKPYGLVFEEAQNFIPQNGKQTSALKLIKKIALEGRKFGFTILLSTQRFAEVSKTVLGRCNVYFLHGAFLPNDIKVYQDYLPYEPAETKSIVSNLYPGEVIYRNGRTTLVTRSRLSYTTRVGETPDLQPDSLVLRQPDKAMLEVLQQRLAPPPQESADEKRQLDIQRDAALRVEQVYKKERDADRATILGMILVIRSLKAQLEAARLVRPPPRPAPPEMTIKVVPQPEWDGRTELAIKRAINRQQGVFNTLVNDIRKMPKLDRVLLVYLTQREQQVFEEKPLARYTGYAYSTLMKHRPADAERFGLIKRTLNKNRTEYLYQSFVRAKLAAECPDLDIDQLVKDICRLEKL